MILFTTGMYVTMMCYRMAEFFIIHHIFHFVCKTAHADLVCSRWFPSTPTGMFLVFLFSIIWYDEKPPTLQYHQHYPTVLRPGKHVGPVLGGGFGCPQRDSIMPVVSQSKLTAMDSILPTRFLMRKKHYLIMCTPDPPQCLSRDEKSSKHSFVNNCQNLNPRHGLGNHYHKRQTSCPPPQSS